MPIFQAKAVDWGYKLLGTGYGIFDFQKTVNFENRPNFQGIFHPEGSILHGFELHDQKRSPWAGLSNGGKLIHVVVVVAELWTIFWGVILDSSEIS